MYGIQPLQQAMALTIKDQINMLNVNINITTSGSPVTFENVKDVFVDSEGRLVVDLGNGNSGQAVFGKWSGYSVEKV
jgi:hypothetical protein